MPIITLLTDFGLDDEYAGVMKGVIYSINPLATLVDITHQNDPQDRVQAAYTLLASYVYFPEGAIHVIVVDPGVGSERKILVAKIDGHFFIAPDNGILDLIILDKQPDLIISAENKCCFLNTVSHTFHGRDIFAPVAAHLSKGMDLGILGPEIPIDRINKLDHEKPLFSQGKQISGTIVSIDRFGNLITNIHKSMIERIFKKKTRIKVRVGTTAITGISGTFSDKEKSAPVAYEGSRGFLEIGVNCGNAKQVLNVDKKDAVVVCL